MSKRIRLIFVSVMVVFVLVACTMSNQVDTNTVSVDKKGVVTETIIEDFTEAYYDADELKEMVDKEVSDYNTKAGQDNVTVTEYEVADGKVTLTRTFASYKDYAELNGKAFFVGTVAEAYDAGYSFADTTSADGSTTLSKTSILEKGDSKIVICEEAKDIKVSGKITYMSDAVVLKDNKTATVTEDGELAYILYQ